jgi:uncharacterized protein (DUF924 family)
MLMDSEQARVLDFWFRELTPADWFGAAESLDPFVRDRFGDLHRRATDGKLDGWATTPAGRVALIIVLDQFPRHIFRGTADAFASDKRAQKLVLDGLEHGVDELLPFAQRHFFYLPLMHAEDPSLQRLSVECFERLQDFATEILGYAKSHRDEVQEFGRFPHRNAALGRADTDAEKAFLSD